jgi:hypothetical protein
VIPPLIGVSFHLKLAYVLKVTASYLLVLMFQFNNIIPNSIGPNAIGPNAIGHIVIVPNSIGPNAIVLKAIGPKAIGPNLDCAVLNLLSSSVLVVCISSIIVTLLVPIPFMLQKGLVQGQQIPHRDSLAKHHSLDHSTREQHLGVLRHFITSSIKYTALKAAVCRGILVGECIIDVESTVQHKSLGSRDPALEYVTPWGWLRWVSTWNGEIVGERDPKILILCLDWANRVLLNNRTVLANLVASNSAKRA